MDKFDNIISECYEPKALNRSMVNSVMDKVSYSCLWRKFKYILYSLLGVAFLFSLLAALDSNFIVLIQILFMDTDVVLKNPKIFMQALVDSMPWVNAIIVLLFIVMVLKERQTIRRYLMLGKVWSKNPVKN